MKNLVNKGFKYFVAIMMVFSLMSMNAWANGPESGTSSETGSTTTENKGTTKDTGDSQGDTADQLISNEEKKTTTSKESDDKEGQTDQTTDKKTDYTYEDKKISVKAVLANASAISDQAELRVKEIPESTTEYKKYQEALNKKSNLYSNVLLYDISFILDGKEVEPTDGNVKVSMSFKDQQLSDDLNVKDNNDLKVIHFKDNDVNKQETLDANTNVNKGTTTFETKSFSAYAVVRENQNELYKKSFYYTKNFTIPDFGYGMTAHHVYQEGHTETNLFTDYLDMRNNSQVGASGIKSPFGEYAFSNAGGYNYIGEFGTSFPQVEGKYHIQFNVQPAMLYLGDTAYRQYTVDNNYRIDCADTNKVIDPSLVKKKSDTQNTLVNSQLSKMAENFTNVINSSAEGTLDSNAISDNFYQGGSKKLDIDLRDQKSGTYIIKYTGNYLDADNLTIYLNKGQNIIFYCTTTGTLHLGRFKINDIGTGDLISKQGEEYDWLTNAVSFYAPNATGLNFNGSVCGIFVAPNADVTKSDSSTSAGIIGCKNFGSSTKFLGGEWHYRNHHLPSPADVQFEGKKQFNGEWPSSGDYTLNLTAINNSPMPSSGKSIVLSKASPNGKFGKITYPANVANKGKPVSYQYEISEAKGSVSNVVYDSTVYEVTVDVTYGDDGSAVVTGTSYKRYIKDQKGQKQYKDQDWISFGDGYQFTFTNTIEENHKLSLRVNKKDENGTNSLTGAVFNLKKDTDFSAGETIDTKDKSYASFENLDPNATYTLTETKAPDHYKTSGPWRVETTNTEVKVYLLSDSNNANIAKAINGQSYAFSVDIKDEKDEIKKFGFKLRKTDAENDKLITNNQATFNLTLIKTIDSNNKMELTSSSKTLTTTLKHGFVSVDNLLVAGKSYYLEETNPPKGYEKSGPWIIEVNDTGAKFYTVTNTNGVISYKSKPTDVNESKGWISYTVSDQKTYTLPSTGGIGTKKYYLLGTLLSMLGVIYIVMKLGKGGLFRKEDHS